MSHKILFMIWEDSQTGIKGFNYRPDWVTNGFAYDIEILAKAKKMNSYYSENNAQQVLKIALFL